MLIYGRDAEIASWVCQQLKKKPYIAGLYRAVGIERNSKLIGAVVWNNYYEDNYGKPLLIEATIATIDKRWATRHNLRELFAYPFIQLKVKRVQATCHRKAKRVRTTLDKLGFHFEGIVREAHPSGGDAAHYSILKSECKWIARERHAVTSASARSDCNSSGANQEQSANWLVSIRPVESKL